MGNASTPPAVRPPAATASTVHFRHHPAKAVAGFIVAISLLTLAVVSPWLTLLSLLPAAWIVWVWRSGTDLGPDAVQVRALLGGRRVPWSQVRGLVADRRGRVAAVLRSGTSLPLPAVTAADLRRLTVADADDADDQPEN